MGKSAARVFIGAFLAVALCAVAAGLSALPRAFAEETPVPNEAAENASTIKTYEELKAACLAGGSYTLGAKIVPGEDFGKGCEVEGDVTLDFNGYRILMPADAKYPLFTVGEGATLTLTCPEKSFDASGIGVDGAAGNALTAEELEGSQGKGAIVVDGGTLSVCCVIDSTCGDKGTYAGAITVMNGGQATSVGANFLNCSGCAGAVQVSDEGSSFTMDGRKSKLSDSDEPAVQAEPIEQGDQSEPLTYTMKGGTISGCTGDGAIRISDDASATMNMGTIEKNISTGKAGAVNLTGAPLVDDFGSFTLNDGTITGNEQALRGSCITVMGGCATINAGTLNGTDCLDEDGNPCGLGGCIYTEDALYVYNGTLNGCNAIDGGCIYCCGEGELHTGDANKSTSKPKILNGHALGNGGGICICTPASSQAISNHTIDTATIKGCTAQGNGGGVYKDSLGTLSFQGSTIDSCTAGGDGGALYFTIGSLSYNDYRYGTGVITACEAERGGAIFIGAVDRRDSDGKLHSTVWTMNGNLSIYDNVAHTAGRDLFIDYVGPFTTRANLEEVDICGENIVATFKQGPLSFDANKRVFDTERVIFAKNSLFVFDQFVGENSAFVVRDDYVDPVGRESTDLRLGGIYGGDDATVAEFEGFTDEDYDGFLTEYRDIIKAVENGGNYRLENDIILYGALEGQEGYTVTRDLGIDFNGHRIIYMPSPYWAFITVGNYPTLFTMADGVTLTLGRSSVQDDRGGIYCGIEGRAIPETQDLRDSEFGGAVFVGKGSTLKLNAILYGFYGTEHPQGSTLIQRRSAGAVSVDTGGTLIMRNSRIILCRGAAGGAIASYGGNVLVESGGFYNCGSDGVLFKDDVAGNAAEGVNEIDINALKNKTPTGGAISIMRVEGSAGKTVISDKSLICDCRALSGSAVADLDDDSPFECAADVVNCRGYDPASIGSQAGQGTFDFEGSPSKQVSLRDLEVVDCTCYGAGAAVCADGCEVQCENCSFMRNFSTTGEGVASVLGSGTLRLSGCHIANNKSNNLAFGSIFVEGGSNLYMDNCSVEADEAVLKGGCLYVGEKDGKGGHAVITDSTFTGHPWGTRFGGCIYNCGTTEIKGTTTLADPLAIVGGCIYQAKGTLILGSENALAEGAGRDYAVTLKNGQAVYATQDPEKRSPYAGGLFVEDGEAYVYGDVCIVDCGSEQYGGGIGQIGGNLHLMGAYIANNQAVYGGGQFNAGGSVQMSETVFENNVAGKAGGALCWSPFQSDVHATLYDGVAFIGNDAQGSSPNGGDDLYVDYLGGFANDGATMHAATVSVFAAYDKTPIRTAIDPAAAAGEPKLSDSYCPECFQLESTHYELYKKAADSMNFRSTSQSSSDIDKPGSEGSADAGANGASNAGVLTGDTSALAIAILVAAVVLADCIAGAAAIRRKRQQR